MSLGISVVGYGMVTAVGFNGPSTCAGLRAGIRGLEVDNLWDPTAGEFLAVGRPKMPQWWEGCELLAELAAPAIEECVEAASLVARGRVDPGTIPIALIVAPRDRPHRWPDLDVRALHDLAHKLGRPLPQGSVLIAAGRTGIVPALKWAADILLRSGQRFCIVAGVESFLRQVIAEHYIEARRLLCATNSNGFSAGEGAAAILLAPSGQQRGPELSILGLGASHDPSGAGGDEKHPVTGSALADALQEAFSAAGRAFWEIDLRMSDANGEHFKFREIALADVRVSRLRPDSARPRRYGHLEHWHPIEYVGEVGSGIFPLMLGYAFDAGNGHYLPSSLILVQSSEDAGWRAAVVAEYQSGAHR